MPVRLCSHTKPDAQPCRGLAMRGSRLCRHHVRQAARDHRRQLALNRGRTVRLGPLSTRTEVYRAILRVLSPLAAGTLPVDRAGRYLCRIQLALAAIHRREHPTVDATGVVR